MNKKNETVFSALGMLLVLYMFCLAPQIENVFAYSHAEVNTAELVRHFDSSSLEYTQERLAPETNKPVSLKQNVLQPLRLTGYGRTISLYIQAPAAGRYENASLTFSLEQGEMRKENCVRLDELPQNGYYMLPISLKGFEVGHVMLSIKSTDFPEGTDAFCFISDWPASGLENAYADGYDLGGVLYIRYDQLFFDKYFVYDVIWLIVLTALIIAVTFSYALKPRRFSDGINLYFCAALLIFATKALENPLMSILGEPKSEAVYDLWYNVNQKSFFENLMTLLSGESLVWPERLLMSLTKLISPESQFFHVALTLELAVIALLTAAPCLPRFKDTFSPVVRLSLALVLGCGIVFEQMYLLWSFSYWCTLWFILMALSDWRKMKKIEFIFCEIVTIICAVSRIYYVVLIPIAALLIGLCGRKRGRRFVCFCTTVILACTAQAVYSFSLGAGHHISGLSTGIDPLQILINTLYYQVQVIISLLLGVQIASHSSAFLLNALGLIAIAAVIVLMIHFLRHGKREWGCILAGLGMLSMGTIMINVITCATTTSVHFPLDYAANVDWNKTVFQKGDLHFSFSYFAVLLLAVSLIYIVLRTIHSHEKQGGCYILNQPVVRYGGITAACVVLLIVHGLRSHTRMPLINAFVDWENSVKVVQQDSYHIAVNTNYPYAQISMDHNAQTMILGRDSTSMYLWNLGDAAYDFSTVYESAVLGEVADFRDKGILAMTVYRSDNGLREPITAIFFDQTGTELARYTQVSSLERRWIDFYPDQPLKGVWRVAFVEPDGTPAYICDSIQLGIESVDDI